MNSKNRARIVLAGSVNSSRKTLEKLIEHKMNIVGVLGLDPVISTNVSGYVDLAELANERNINFKYFEKINANDTVQFVRECRPDYLFVVGLSQLVKEPLLRLPSRGCIGFHPTKLPKGRGRGAVAWLIMGKVPGAATFFRLGEGMDDGPILAQEEFVVNPEDYAQDVIDKIIKKIGVCLDRLLPKIKSDTINAIEQDHSIATYLGKRNPEDGWIDWEKPANEIVQLIKAVSEPLPGAFSCINGKKIIIDKAVVNNCNNFLGVVGRILKKDEKGILVQSGDGSVWIQKYRGITGEKLNVGHKFRSQLEFRIEKLEQEIQRLKKSSFDE